MRIVVDRIFEARIEERAAHEAAKFVQSVANFKDQLSQLQVDTTD
jgi:hypothetical protein